MTWLVWPLLLVCEAVEQQLHPLETVSGETEMFACLCGRVIDRQKRRRSRETPR